MPLFIDDREPKDIIDFFRKHNLLVEVKRIESGDYVFGDVAIERKTVNDLIGSVAGPSRRFWEQLEVMKEAYKLPILLVEGHVNWRDRLLSGILGTVLLFWNVPILQSYNYLESALIIENLFVKYGIGKTGRIPPAGVRKPRNEKDVQLEILQCFEGIGPVTAKKILDKVPFPDIAKGDPIEVLKELRELKGLGKKKITRLLKVVQGIEVT